MLSIKEAEMSIQENKYEAERQRCALHHFRQQKTTEQIERV